ncbi:MAG: efflux RND transporter permease subunit, partial [Planctomycetes bacterium]|nr:efflux RND transporter permease subunit [Planctomycetota bacterium]
MRTGLLGFGIHRPVGMLMVVLASVVFGIVSLSKLPVDLLPPIDYPSLTVRTSYPGAAPEDVEERVTEQLEDVLSTVGSLVRIRSSSRAEVSEILMEFEWGSNLPFLVQDVRERIDRVFLSQGIERPLILRYDPSLDPILRIAVAGGKDLVRLRDLAEQEIERELEGLPGVAAVRVSGGLEDEIQVQIDPQRLANLRIPAELIRQRLTEENLNVPGGTLEEGATEYVVRTLNEFRSLEQIEALPILRRGEAIILLRDVARVERTHKDRDVILRTASKEAVEVEVFREDGANIVEVAQRVRDKIYGEKIHPRAAARGQIGPTPIVKKLPQDVTLTLLSDQSQFVSNAISEVRSAAAIGGLMAIAVCFLFLRRLAITVIIGLSVPISVIAAFGAMYGAGVTLNVMSLGGLALGIGMLVDNSIVVLESITRCREEGDSPLEAALRGVREVGSAVTASTLTTIAVFAPIVFVEGVAGQTFGDQSLTVVASLIISLAVALFFIPGLAARARLGVAGEKSGDGPREWMATHRQNFTRKPNLSHVPRNRSLWLLGIAGLAVAGYLAVPLTQQLIAPFATETAPSKKLDLPAEIEGKVALYRYLSIVVAIPGLWTFGQLTAALATWALTMTMATVVLLTRFALAAVLSVVTLALWLPGQAVQILLTMIEKVYRPFLAGALRVPLLVGFIVGVVAFGTWQTAKGLGRELLPEVLQSELTAELFFPAGSPLTETDAIAARLEQAAREIKGVLETAVTAGSDRESISSEEEGPHTARLLLRTEGGPNARNTELSVERQLRELLDDEPALARYNLRRPTLLALNAPLEIEILGDDLEGIGETAREVQDAISGTPGIIDLRSSLRRGNPEVRVTLDREQLARHNLTVAAVADRLRLAVEGQISSTFPGKDERIDIRVRADLSTMRHVEQLASLPVNPDAERPLTLGSVATLTVADGPSEIRHIGGRRAAVLSASLSGFDLGATGAEVERRLSKLKLPVDRSISLGGQTAEMESALDSLTFALLLAIFLVYAVMAAQFESLVQPLLIMFSVPLAAVGAVIALSLTGTPISVVALLGAVVLAGIVVNNAIVLVDRINRNRTSGQELDRAILEAGITRLRPILMTTVTTVLGMLPLTGLFGAAEGAELRAPMALVVIAGLSASTLLTLVVIPVGYRVLAVVTSRSHD